MQTDTEAVNHVNEYWNVHDDVIKWKHFPRYWPFVQGIHRSPVNSSHKGQWRRALMFSLICAWINHWVNKGEAGDLRCYRGHYDVIVMCHHLYRCNRTASTRWLYYGGHGEDVLYMRWRYYIRGGCIIYKEEVLYMRRRYYIHNVPWDFSSQFKWYHQSMV